jgi:hypothetical protein
MIEAVIVFGIIFFVLLFITCVNVGNKTIKELEKKAPTTYTENEL